jgi:hypothetical protein
VAIARQTSAMVETLAAMLRFFRRMLRAAWQFVTNRGELFAIVRTSFCSGLLENLNKQGPSPTKVGSG